MIARNSYGVVIFIKCLQSLSDRVTSLDDAIANVTQPMTSNPTGPTATEPLVRNYSAILTGLRNEEKQQKNKESNIIIKSPLILKEPDTQQDLNLAYELIKQTMPEEPNPVIKNVKRIDAKTQSLLLIELPDPKIKWQVLKNTNKLRNLPKYRGTYLNADLTPNSGNNNTS